MGQCKSKHVKISVLNHTYGDLLYFNILNYVNQYIPVKTIDDVQKSVYKYKNINIKSHNIIIIVIQKNKNLMTTIWYYDNTTVPYNIIETHCHFTERDLNIYLNDFTRLLIDGKLFNETDEHDSLY